jgi:hypothetical protein
VDGLHQKTHADADANCDFNRNNATDLKAIVHFKKRKGDAAVPSLRSHLKQRFDA